VRVRGCLSIGGLEMAGSDARWGGGASWAGLACGVGLMGCAWYGFVGLWVCAFGKGGEEKVVAGLGGVHDYIFVRERV